MYPVSRVLIFLLPLLRSEEGESKKVLLQGTGEKLQLIVTASVFNLLTLCGVIVFSTHHGSIDKGPNFHLGANKSKRNRGGILGIPFQDLARKNDR